MVSICLRQNALCSVWRNQNNFEVSPIWSNDRCVELNMLDSKVFEGSPITRLSHVKCRDKGLTCIIRNHTTWLFSSSLSISRRKESRTRVLNSFSKKIVGAIHPEGFLNCSGSINQPRSVAMIEINSCSVCHPLCIFAVNLKGCTNQNVLNIAPSEFVVLFKHHCRHP